MNECDDSKINERTQTKPSATWPRNRAVSEVNRARVDKENRREEEKKRRVGNGGKPPIRILVAHACSGPTVN